MTTTMKQAQAGRKSLDVKGSSDISSLDELADEAVIALFNAFSSSVRKYPRRPFTLSESKPDIGRARQIVSGWAPQQYGSGLSQSDFDVPYMLSAFFDRYISVSERKLERELQAKAARKFLATNADGDAIDSYVLNHPSMAPLITKMRYHIGTIMPVFDINEVYMSAKHGPNSTTGVSFQDAYIHIKNGDISGNRASLQQFVHYLSWDPVLRAEVIDLKPGIREYLNATPHDFSGVDVVDYTRTSFVPKKFDSLRTMNPEATLPSWFGQGVAEGLTKVLLGLGIDLKTQPIVHRQLAKLGSKIPELNIATIDWSEASDRIWLTLCLELFSEGNAPTWMRFITNVCRCDYAEVKFSGKFGDGVFDSLSMLNSFCIEHYETFNVKVSRDGKRYSVVGRVRTTMLATMGNPVTFPLQTLVFYVFLLSCTELFAEQEHQTTGSYPDTVFPSSFGDDGIVDVRAMPFIEKYAKMLNWRLNLDKSYAAGGFRESCGGDYYDGRYCRPFSPKRPPLETSNNPKLCFQSWLYILANNVIDRVKLVGGSTALVDQWLLTYHSKAKLGSICVVPPSYPDGSGLRVESFVDADMEMLYDERQQTLWCSPGLDGPGYLPLGFHSPTWENGPNEKCFKFRAIISSPDDLALDEWDMGHYYHICLKYRRSLADFAKGISVYHQPSFFESHKGQAMLDDAGCIPVKHCQLYKRSTTATLWL